MSGSISHMRSSIDLGTGIEPKNTAELMKAKQGARTHPPRLQHSPSLPNIWIPPHSGPIPPELVSKLDIPQRPPTPTRFTSKSSLALPASPQTMTEEFKTDTPTTKTREKKALQDSGSTSAETKHNSRTYQHQFKRRHRKDHAQHSLLTPPLTPSSSIRTTASFDSPGNHGVKQDGLEASSATESPGNDDLGATRFLLLGNVSRQISPTILRSAILDRLAAAPPQGENLSVEAQTFNDTIKGIFVRYQKTQGIVLLAFYDIRQAKRASTFLSTPCAGPLSECQGDGKWFTCRFVTSEDLKNSIGDSQFLASTDGGFSISVRGIPVASDVDADVSKNECPNDTLSSTPDHANANVDKGEPLERSETRVINPSMLKCVLESYGDLLSFTLSVDTSKNSQTDAIVYSVEFYDTRDADDAYLALDKQVMFGMSIRVYGREIAKRSSHPQPGFHKNVILFPSSASDEPLQIRPAGESSRIRDRFTLVDAPERDRPRSVSAGQHTSPATRAPSPGNVLAPDAPAPSPIYFYTSPVNELPSTLNMSGENVQTRYSDPPLLDASSPQLSNNLNNQEQYSAARPIAGLREVRDDNVDVHVQCYTSPRDCYYCPSRGPMPGAATHPAYFPPCLTSSPMYYPASQPIQAPPPMVVAAPQGPSRYVYEYEPAPSSQVVNSLTLNWNFEHAMLSGNNNLSLAPHSRIPYWLPESQGLAPPVGPYYPQLTPSPDVHQHFYPHMNDMQTPGHFDPSSQPPIYVSNRQPASSASGDSPLLPSHHGSSTINSNFISNVAPERNQLNLARIEDGQDTRTTVMIKNIPNKMSDKDLVLYIGKVCPRKIDFLYLRMDFQNGCNVGYAFVNFITAQDLLCFAKQRLGEKWNMFSSEKVLQMSYANYQGKEALVEKFKNSCIMDEREAWRPKIFYSSGHEQGLPEPFPAPTHLRRKERSSFNRGALFVPGVGNGTQQYNHLHNPSRRHNHAEDQRTTTSRYLERQHQRFRGSLPNTS